MRDKCAICQKELTSIETRRIGDFVYCRDCEHFGDVSVHTNKVLKEFFDLAGFYYNLQKEKDTRHAVESASNDILKDG